MESGGARLWLEARSPLQNSFNSMNAPPTSVNFKRRTIRGLAIAYVTAGLFLIQAAAILLATFEAAAWGMKLLVRALGVGNAPVRRLPILKI
jgi:hypothetical protein